jgi:hypothetical protein
MSTGAIRTEAPLELHASKPKAALLLGGALLFIAIAYALWRFWAASGRATYELVFPAIFLAGGVLVLAQAVHLLARSEPIVRVSPTGLIDESSLSAVGLVPWVEVAALVPWHISFQAFLGILLKDPEAFAARLGPWRRLVLRMNLRLGFPPILIAQVVLPVSTAELAHQIHGRFGVPILSA